MPNLPSSRRSDFVTLLAKRPPHVRRVTHRTREQTGLSSQIFAKQSALYHRGRSALYQRIVRQDSVRNGIVKEFQRLYYNTRSRTWLNTNWLGVPIIKCPFDLWIYQEMLFELRPDLVVECGTSKGGSAYFLSSMCELVGHGHVITIDLYPKPNRPQHERLTYVSGSSTDPRIIEEVTRRIRDADGEGASVLVILDSDHSREHVLDELRLPTCDAGELRNRRGHTAKRPSRLAGFRPWTDGSRRYLSLRERRVRGRHVKGKVLPDLESEGISQAGQGQCRRHEPWVGSPPRPMAACANAYSGPKPQRAACVNAAELRERVTQPPDSLGPRTLR